MSLAGDMSDYPEKEAIAVCTAADLLAAGSEGHGDKVVGILEADLELLRVGDLNGDTVFHLLVAGGYVDSLLHLLRFMLGKNPKLLKEVANQENARGITPLQLAVKNDHMWILNLLEKDEDESFYIKNGDGKTPWKLTGDNWGWCCGYFDSLLNKGNSSEEEKEISVNKKLLDEICNTHNRFNNTFLSPRRYPISAVIEIDMERKFMEIVGYAKKKENISEVMEYYPYLLEYKNRRGDTILHELALSEKMDMLTKLVEHLVTTSRMSRRDDESQLPTLSLLMESNKNGCTPLHLAINNGKMKASRYLMEVAPEAAFKLNNKGESPLYVAIKEGHDELVNYVLKVMPEASMSPATRSSLLTPNKSSLPHVAIK